VFRQQATPKAKEWLESNSVLFWIFSHSGKFFGKEIHLYLLIIL
jgi:hypothetical protein